jgi:hypothetical protein
MKKIFMIQEKLITSRKSNTDRQYNTIQYNTIYIYIYAIQYNTIQYNTIAKIKRTMIYRILRRKLQIK